MKLSVSNLTKRYGAQAALDGLDLEIASETRCMALIGPSGGGKSTFLRVLAGLEISDSGRVEVNGSTVPTSPRELLAYRRQNGVLFQSYSLFPHLTARRNITLPLEQTQGKSPAEAARIAEENLKRFGLAEHADKHPHQLSGGQQQRVALIRAISAQPQFLFLDEPTAALDPEMTVEVLELIRELVQGGQQVIFCTHEMGFAQAVADVVAFVAAGKILEFGPPKEIFGAPRDELARRFFNKVLEFR